MDEDRAIKAYEAIMQCTEADARCVFMFISADYDEEHDTEPAAQTSF